MAVFLGDGQLLEGVKVVSVRRKKAIHLVNGFKKADEKEDVITELFRTALIFSVSVSFLARQNCCSLPLPFSALSGCLITFSGRPFHIFRPKLKHAVSINCSANLVSYWFIVNKKRKNLPKGHSNTETQTRIFEPVFTAYDSVHFISLIPTITSINSFT